jgi:endonuclease YncB( thermonuclease family)
MKTLSFRAHLSKAAVLLLILLVSVSVVAQTVVFQGRVVNVTNGDTITVLAPSNTEFLVRCRGIDAPKGKEDFASHSKQRLTDLLLDEPVTVRYAQKSDNGELVGTIEWNERDICLDQVRAGMASYDRESEQRRSTQQQYALAEAGARKNRIGLWGAPDGRQSTATDSQGKTVLSSADTTVDVRGYFKKDGTYVAGQKRTARDGNSYAGQAATKKQSRWTTALKWIGYGAALGALIYLDAKYPTATGTATATATARCNDGTYSYSRHRQGTCSHHGGVAYWLW